MTVPLYSSASSIPIGVMFGAPFDGETRLHRVPGLPQ
jgi:hypothetical protein